MRYSIISALLLLLGYFARGQEDTLVVHFGIDKADIRLRDRTSLDSLVAGMAALDPVTHKVAFYLTGHTDNSGNDEQNIRLSEQRAYAVRDYLRSKGYPDTLFSIIRGFGSHVPLNDNSNESKRSMNRRVEIILLRIDLTRHIISPTPSVKTADTVDESEDPNTTIYRKPPSLSEIFRDTANLVGKNIVLRNVNFYGDRHIPLPGSTIVLEELAAIMKEYPGLHIEIQGYVCCMSDGFDGRDADLGSPNLSTQRAKFVYEFLVGQGIKKSRMSYKGFGASNKIFPEERDELQKTGNRRVEIKIVKFGP
jgi:outer membrane protein OmpA-like peptidoglycan-associated protein